MTEPPPSEPAKFPWYARPGAVCWIVGPIQFVIVMIVVQLAWTTPYNIAENAVSDLGAVACAENAMGTSFVCSPWHDAFNASIIVFGVLVAVGAAAVRRAFPAGRVASWATGILIVAGGGAALVGIFPEDVFGPGHALGATLAFVGACLAMILFGVAMTDRPDWAGYRLLSWGGGLFSGSAIILSDIFPTLGPIGFGGFERLIVAPALVWLVVIGFRNARQLTRLRNTGPSGSSGTSRSAR